MLGPGELVQSIRTIAVQAGPEFKFPICTQEELGVVT